MKKRLSILNNEDGSALLISLLILGLLTLLGIFATNTTNIEIQIAGNDKVHKLAFYAAEAAIGYVAGNTSLYGPNNITVGGKLYFPNNDNTSEKYLLDSTQSFAGDVGYTGSSEPPRGSGYEVGKFKAHRYEMTCNGYGLSNAESRIKAGFYRIGF
jgi:hypothetical protein